MSAPSAPLLVAVDDDPDLLRDVERELRNRYASDYRVCCLSSPDEARRTLDELAAAGAEVALVLAAEELDGTPGAELLAGVPILFPHAQRALLLPWSRVGDPTAGDAVFEAIARGRIDQYLVRPAPPPDEQFHLAVSSFLLRWAEARRRAPHTIDVVGESWDGRAYELREVLGRCAMPHRFCLAGSPEGRAILADAGLDRRLPLLRMPDGRVMEDPSDIDIARSAGTTLETSGERFDLVIVGCGPAGLSAGVYGASEGLRTIVIDSGSIGGQATASSSIRNYLGFPRGLSGADLARRAYEQAWVFGARFAFMQHVTNLARQDDGLVLTLNTGGVVMARAVLLAMGASYRRLGVETLEALRGAGVYYGAAASEAPLVAGEEVFIVGGANSAGQAALHLAHYAKRVTLVIRAASLTAGMSHYLVRQVEGTPNIDVRTSAEVVDGGGDGRLQHLVLRDRTTREQETVDAFALFLMIGARPHTEWLPPAVERDGDGFVVTGMDLSDQAVRALGHRPLALETSVPGVLAAGDVRHGSVKRVASAVGEGGIAIQQVHRLLAT
jgi:thioredoxin reductase (NADPH)